MPRLSRLLALVAAATAAGLVAHAEELILRPAVVHPLTGPPRTNVNVLVRDGRIAAVDAAVPAGARVVPLDGLQLFPGLVAPDTVLGLQEIASVRATLDSSETGEFAPDVFAWIAVNPDSDMIPVARANGYTHAESIPTGGTVAGHSAVIRLEGWTIEDLAVRRDAALHVSWPGFGIDTTPRTPFPGRSPEDQVKDRQKALRTIDAFFDDAEAYAKARKAAGFGDEPVVVPASGKPARPAAEPRSFARIPAWEAMLPALRGDIPVVIHADEVRQIRSAVEWGVRRKYRIAIAGGRDAWKLAALLAQHRVPVAYEDVFTQPPRDTDPYDVQFAAPGILNAAGVEVSFTEGSNRFGAAGLRNIPYAAAQAMAFGLPRLEAHRGLSLYPARLLGIADRLGSIEPGKDATLIAVDGDILDLRVNVRRMWIAGREVSLESRHTRLYERYRSRPKAGK